MYLCGIEVSKRYMIDLKKKYHNKVYLNFKNVILNFGKKSFDNHPRNEHLILTFPLTHRYCESHFRRFLSGNLARKMKNNKSTIKNKATLISIRLTISSQLSIIPPIFLQLK